MPTRPARLSEPYAIIRRVGSRVPMSHGDATLWSCSRRLGVQRREPSIEEAEMAEPTAREIAHFGCLWLRLALASVIFLIGLIAVIVTFPILILFFLMVPFLIIFI